MIIHALSACRQLADMSTAAGNHLVDMSCLFCHSLLLIICLLLGVVLERHASLPMFQTKFAENMSRPFS